MRMQTTTYYFIRHAEKNMENPYDFNPSLTAEGEKRALFWASYFQDKKIDRVFYTSMIRTQQTIAPFLKENHLTGELYAIHQLISAEFMSSTKGKNVLIVGHQTTIPTSLNKLLRTTEHKKIPLDVYGKLFKVTLTENQAPHLEVSIPSH